MKISESGIDLIKQYEGLRLEPYLDVAGKQTVGYGHLVRDNEEFGTITEEQAEYILLADLEIAEKCVNSAVRTPLSQAEFDALVSFVFNLGCMAFRNSTLLRLVNRGDLDAAADEFERWVYAGGKKVRGLQIRRLAERNHFLGMA